MAGLTEIPAICVHADEKKSAIIAMLENLQRENLHYMEEALGYKALMEKYGFTQDELATKLGKSQSTVANKLRLLKMSLPVRELIMNHGLTERHSRTLLRLEGEIGRIKAISQIVEKKLTVVKTEEYVDTILLSQEEKLKKEKNKRFKAKYDIRLIANSLKDSVEMMNKLGMKVRMNKMENDANYQFVITIPKT